MDNNVAEFKPREAPKEPEVVKEVPKESQTMEFNCISPMCRDKGRKIFRSRIQPEILNGVSNSSLVYSHERGMTCQYCNTYYQIGIVNFQVSVTWGIQPVERPSDVILAPSGMVAT